MKNWLLVLAGISAFSAVRADSAPGTALPKAPTVSVSSPNQVLTVEVTESDGFPVYRVLRFGKPVIGYSHLGFVLKDAGKLAYQLHVVAPTEAPHGVDETWEQPWGERRYIRNHYSEQTVRLTEPKGLRRELEVIVRVYDDGIGFRYAFPDQPQLHDVVIADE